MDEIPIEDGAPTLAKARARVAEAIAAAATDPGAPFVPDAVQAFVELKRDAVPEYVSAREQLRRARVPLREFDRAIRAIREVLEPKPRVVVPFPTAQTVAPSPDAEWKRNLTRNRFNEIEPVTANCVTALIECPAWKDVLAFNEFAEAIEFRKPAPWYADDQPLNGSRPGEFGEYDDARLANWFARELGIDVSRGTAAIAAFLVAQRTSFHPVREYLDALAWDGTLRLASWLVDYCGAKGQPPEYLSRVGTWFLISAVARIYRPGCKADHCIVLEGAQGKGKSSLAEALSPVSSWYTVHHEDLASKDSQIKLSGRWIIEMSELDSLRRAELGRVKRFMSQSTDDYRAPYEKKAKQHPRQCVFVGTTNEHDYLRDTTGNRRFWPVSVGAIDVPGIITARDQLWAEAVYYFRQDARWWPHLEDAALLGDEQEARRLEYAWEGIIETWLDARVLKASNSRAGGDLTATPVCTVADVLSLCIGKQKGDWKDGDTQEVGKILTALGWVKVRTRKLADGENRDGSGKRRLARAYAPPEMVDEHGNLIEPEVTEVPDDSF
jgi:putative DNA primase/helicase